MSDRSHDRVEDLLDVTGAGAEDSTVVDMLGIYSRIVTCADRGKWRERTELLRTLESLSWFDNYGEHVYNVRMSAVVHIAHMVEVDELPASLQLMIEEARDAVDYVDMEGDA
jgi:hypothetical protein